jgi:hypothetical protein
MNNTEMIKQNIVEKRLTLAMLMHNASSKMTKDEVEAMQSDCQRLHLFATNGDFKGALEGTERLIKQIQHRVSND